VLGTWLVERIRIILNGSIGLQRDSSTNTNGDDFYDPGMTSRSTVLLMMALEEAFGVERLVV
jgi:acyl carrier protein